MTDKLTPTPLTDGLAFTEWCEWTGTQRELVMADDMRQLERDLAALREKVEAETIERCAPAICKYCAAETSRTGGAHYLSNFDQHIPCNAAAIRALLPAPPAGKG